MENIKFLDMLYYKDGLTLEEFNKQLIHLLFKKVHTSNSKESALKIYQELKPNMIIIVVNHESNNYIDFIEKIREEDIYIPIVLISQSRNSDSLLNLINLQLDGFLEIPIELDLLSKCLKNCLKKIEFNEVCYIDEKITYNIRNKELYILDKYVKIGKKLNELLFLFVKNQNKILSKERLEHEIWNDFTVSDSSIKNLIGNLRKVIGKDKIINVTGIGWKLNVKNK